MWDWDAQNTVKQEYPAALLTAQRMRSNQEPGHAHGIVMGMIYLRNTDNLQQRPSEHLEFGKLWENLLKANTAAHLHGFHVQPECDCTCTLTVQGAEEFTLHLTASLNARAGCVHKALPSFLSTPRVCAMETNTWPWSWREQGGNQEVGVSIIPCSSQGCYNPANSYFRMIDKTQLIQLCRMRKMNSHQTHQRQCISCPPCGHRPWDGHETFSLCILHMWKLSLIKREVTQPSPTSQFQKRPRHTWSTFNRMELNKK